MRISLTINTMRVAFVSLLFAIFVCFPLSSSVSTLDWDEVEFQEEFELNYINYTDLYNKIAKIESRQNYDVANKSRMVGKYQASRVALLEFGYSEEQVQNIYDSFDTTYTDKGYARYHFDVNTFPPEDQERFIRWYMHRMETVYLKEIINKYVGTTINNVYITRAGILNASMLGFNHVVRFLETDGKVNYTPKRGYSVQGRLAQFERTEIES